MSLRFHTTTSKGKILFYSFIKIKFCHRVLTVEISVECLRELQVAKSKPDIFASSLYLYSGLPGTLSRLVCVHVAAAAALVLQACSFLFFTLVPSLLAVSQLASA